MNVRNDTRHASRGKSRIIPCCATVLVLMQSAVAPAEHEQMMRHRNAQEATEQEMHSDASAAEDAQSPADSQTSQATASPDAAQAIASIPSLPAFSGTPRIYHLGATDFFLDHPEHIALAPQQRKALEQLKSKALAEQNRYREEIDKAENALWSLTGAETPDGAAIASKVREIENLRARERLAYIQAVGTAAEILTEEQRKQLAGVTSPKPANAPPVK